MLVIVGLWVAIVGYGVLYTGVQKLAGDPHFTLRKAFQGQSAQTPATSTGAVSGLSGPGAVAGGQQLVSPGGGSW